MKFKDNLRKQRTKANLSQESLAEKVSVSRQTISKWENGDTYPSTRHIFMLSEILNCDVNQLIDDESNSAKTTTKKTPPKRVYYLLAGTTVALFITVGLLALLATIYFCKNDDDYLRRCQYLDGHDRLPEDI